MKHHPENYLNRELSWLEFNQRVLDLAGLDEVPLLERVKFLAISGSNLDEFFKVRVGGLRLAAAGGSEFVELSGLTIDQQLVAIRKRIREMNQAQSRTLLDQLLPQLATQGVVRLAADTLTPAQSNMLQQIFSKQISSTIAPIAIEQGRSFPLLAGATICMCVRMRRNDSCTMGAPAITEHEAEERFAVIPIGASLSRFVNLPCDSGYGFMFIEDAIGHSLPQLFPNQEILEWAAFRMTRNADIELNDDAMADLLKEMTEMLDQRKVSRIIRLEIASTASAPMLQFLQAATGAADDDVFLIPGPIDLAAFFELSLIQGFPQLKDKPWPAQPSPDFADAHSIFETIATSDRLLIHPYQSFDPVIDFVREAAADPAVIAIKQTLYRTSAESEIIEALVEAAGNGKQVTVIVELKARFDEARNIEGAKQLEQAGVDVIYGVQGLKTHAKVCLVVRKEPRGIQRYVHFGTGNYNESTARLYGDISYFTNHEQLSSDANLFFNAITGLSVPQPLKLLAAAPIDLKETLLELIQAEIEHAKQGGACQINAKINSLVDREIIDALYEASQEGVRIRMNVRGICCLKPGKKGLSENIEVISIVDRFLEHARIIHFSHGGEDIVFISSADWMGRNLHRRAELLVPIADDDCRNRLLSVLAAYFKDNVRAKRLDSSGAYSPVEQTMPADRFRVQEHLYQEAHDLFAAYSNPKATVFRAIRGESA